MTALSLREALNEGFAESSSAASLIASLARFELPFELDRFGISFANFASHRSPGPLSFRFCFKEVPFQGRAERRDSHPVLTLTGDLGILPFTIENARKRQRLRKIISAVRHASGLPWEITTRHRIQVTSELNLGMPLTPTAVIAGTATLLLRSRPYLDLVVAVAGEE